MFHYCSFQPQYLNIWYLVEIGNQRRNSFCGIPFVPPPTPTTLSLFRDPPSGYHKLPSQTEVQISHDVNRVEVRMMPMIEYHAYTGVYHMLVEPAGMLMHAQYVTVTIQLPHASLKVVLHSVVMIL